MTDTWADGDYKISLQQEKWRVWKFRGWREVVKADPKKFKIEYEAGENFTVKLYLLNSVEWVCVDELPPWRGR